MSANEKEASDKAEHDVRYNNNNAELFDSFRNPTTCGHSVPLAQIVARVQGNKIASCPVCDGPVAYIRNTGPNSSLDLSNNNHTSCCFKYGKIIYRLHIPTAAVEHDTPWWKMLLFWGSNEAANITVQQRIQSVLGLSQGMKILSKGKVLYPLPVYTSSTKDDMERELSNHLLEISSTMSATAATPTLLVVGTPSSTQSDWLETEQRHLATGNKGDLWTIVSTTTVSDVWRFGFYIASSSIRWTTSFVWGLGGVIRDSVYRWFRGNGNVS